MYADDTQVFATAKHPAEFIIWIKSANSYQATNYSIIEPTQN